MVFFSAAVRKDSVSHLKFIITSNLKLYNWLKYLKPYHYEVHRISFQTVFIWAFKIVVNSWKFSMLLLYILWDDWPIFMISRSNQQLQQEFEYNLLKPDCHSW